MTIDRSGPRYVFSVAVFFTALWLLATLTGCQPTAKRTPLGPAAPPPAAEAEQQKEEGPPRPPDRAELAQIGELPAGESLTGGLPGGNAKVNQDSSGQAQNETSIIANPADPLNLVGGWNDYFAVNPGQNTVIGYGWTLDGGQTWQSGRVDFATLPSNQSTGDPAFTADGQGNFYMGILAYGGTASGILVARSTDGGASWAEPVRLDNGGDKEFLTVDLANDNVYVVWENNEQFVQTIFFSKSTDLGLSYTPRQAISNAASAGNGAYPAVGPDGEIYVVWSNFGNRLNFDRSLDEGNSWLATDVVVTDTIDTPRNPLQGGFRNPMIPAVAVDTTGGPFRGRIYVVWADERFTGDPDIAISYSDDRGDTWSAPLRVNDDVGGNDADQFFPWVTVDDNGHVHVTFLDRRDDPGGLLLAMYLATSTDGAISFGPNIRISDGLYGPSNFGFLGDYTGAAVTADNRIVPLWPDGRFGDEDVFAQSVDLADYDEDAILNDGDGDGQYAGNRCTGGNNVDCDDNCPGTPNPAQLDGDADLVGDACDNCPNEFNTDQADGDRDGFGDVCDGCPGQPGGDGDDPDGDGVASCVDNCPGVSNAGQEDGDGDGLGDVCDPCPATALNDEDLDGLCGDVDNCVAAFNPLQLDGDGDGVGDLCDVCPDVFDPGQADGDGDGAGDACDCQSLDGNDRQPAVVRNVRLDRAGSTAQLSWDAAEGADAYSVSRGDLSLLAVNQYGGCFAEGLELPGVDDPDVLSAGQGVFYVVQAQSFDCGLGPLGYRSSETLRVNDDPGACGGVVHVDVNADGEVPVTGTVSGTFLDTGASDDTVESITEVESKGGNPSLRHTLLEHHWSVQVPAGSRTEFHVEGFRSNAGDGDNFVFEYSTDGGASWNPISLFSLPLADDGTDLQGVLPAGLSGSVLFRVIDTNRAPGGLALDTVSIDELFVRSVP